MSELLSYLQHAVDRRASDVFFIAGLPVSFKLDGSIRSLEDKFLSPVRTESLLSEIYVLAGREMEPFRHSGDDDFSFSVPGMSRFRVNAYRQRGSMAAVIRVVAFDVPQAEPLGIPPAVVNLCRTQRGMILVTGPAGSGKSTTLACLIDAINRERNCHIITLEDPIEYLHRNNKSVISQREIAMDTANCLTALRACLRQAPDVILLGEMRDRETIQTAMTAAETGHLLISTLHTVGAVNTIDRIIDVFPPNQQRQMRVQLAMILTSVVSQQLLPTVNGGQIPAFEIMQVTPAIRNLIREEKTHQIDNVIQGASAEGMVSMDSYILDLCRSGRITPTTALLYAANPEQMQRRL